MLLHHRHFLAAHEPKSTVTTSQIDDSLLKWIQITLPTEVTNIITFYSKSCVGENRNHNIMALTSHD